MDPKKVSALLLQIVDAASVRGDSVELVAQAKQWLRDVNSGKLVVGAPLPPETQK